MRDSQLREEWHFNHIFFITFSFSWKFIMKSSQSSSYLTILTSTSFSLHPDSNRIIFLTTKASIRRWYGRSHTEMEIEPVFVDEEFYVGSDFLPKIKWEDGWFLADLWGRTIVKDHFCGRSILKLPLTVFKSVYLLHCWQRHSLTATYILESLIFEL